jgi:predicted DNA-binding protein (UPF0251 family)
VESKPPVIKSRSEQFIEIRLGEDLESILRRLYHDEGMTQGAIALRWGVSRATVNRWMFKYGIDSRHVPQIEEVA